MRLSISSFNPIDEYIMELDHFDRLLLNLVQEDAGRTAESIAEEVALSPSAIQRRIRRMREQGVILRDISVVDPRKLAPSTAFVVSIHVEQERPELLSQFRSWLSTQRNVQQAFYVTGEADFVLIVTAPSTESYDVFMSRLVSENPNVKRFTTNVALGIVKRGLTVPALVGHDDQPNAS